MSRWKDDGVGGGRVDDGGGSGTGRCRAGLLSGEKITRCTVTWAWSLVVTGSVG